MDGATLISNSLMLLKSLEGLIGKFLKALKPLVYLQHPSYKIQASFEKRAEGNEIAAHSP